MVYNHLGKIRMTRMIYRSEMSDPSTASRIYEAKGLGFCVEDVGFGGERGGRLKFKGTMLNENSQQAQCSSRL